MSAFFSGTETAFFSLDSIQKKRIRKEKNGELVLLLLQRPDRLLSAILLGNTLVNVFASAIAAVMMERIFPGGFGLVLSILGMTFIIVVLGEISPKTFALSRNSSWAVKNAPVVAFFVRLCKPVSALLSNTSLIVNILSKKNSEAGDFSGEEVISLVEMGISEGVLGIEAAATSSLLTLKKKLCRHAMIPRRSVQVVRTDWERNRMVQFIRLSPFTRFPLLDGSEENVLGYLETDEILLSEKDEDILLHEISFFPENAPLSRVLSELRKKGEKIGIVVDEYGDWIGIISVADILLTTIFNRLSTDGELLEGVSRKGSSFVVPGSLKIEILSELLGTDFYTEHAETCAGYLEEKTGKIFTEGERISISGFQFHVLKTSGPRIDLLEVRPVKSGEDRK